MRGPVLDSWKAIAAHLGRTVRTVQRWEQYEGLPIHRHQHAVLGSVHAYVDEIDDWKRRLTVGSPSANAAAAPAHPGIAVLPLRPVGSDGDEGLAAMLANGIIRGLSRLSGLRVVSSASSACIRQATPHASLQTARSINVAFLVDGTLARVEGRWHASLQLVSTHDDRVAWSHGFDFSSGEIFDFEDTVADEIARQVMSASPRRNSERPGRPPVDRKAFDAYARAVALLDLMSIAEFQRGHQLLTLACTRDDSVPEFHAALATWHLRAVLNRVVPRREGFRQARHSAEAALRLDGDLADARVALGYLAMLEWRWPEVQEHYGAAIAVEPNNAVAHRRLARYLACRGASERSRTHAETAVMLDPLSRAPLIDLAISHYAARDYETALMVCARALAFNDLSGHTYHQKGVTEICLGRLDDAVDSLTRAAQLSNGHSSAIAALGIAHTRRGDAAAGRKMADELRRRCDSRPDEAPEWMDLAEVCAALGETPHAITALEHATRLRLPEMAGILVDPFLDPVRSHPAFATIVETVGLN